MKENYWLTFLSHTHHCGTTTLLTIVIEICVTLLEKLVDEFDNKLKKEDIKQEWHSLQVSYKRGKAREEGSKTSGSDCSEVYYSTWEHFNQTEFLDDTANIDESCTSLDSEPYGPP